MRFADRPKETIMITKEVLSLHEKYPGILDRDKVAYTKQHLAEAHCACGEWEDAVKIYKSLIVKIYTSLIDKSLQYEYPGELYTLALNGFNQSMYEMGRYDEVISDELLNDAHRTFPGVHKYVALALKAQGNIYEAKKTISRAILYEVHWDKDNLRQNQQILKELNSL